jgi:hypothetical protein
MGFAKSAIHPTTCAKAALVSGLRWPKPLFAEKLLYWNFIPRRELAHESRFQCTFSRNRAIYRRASRYLTITLPRMRREKSGTTMLAGEIEYWTRSPLSYAAFASERPAHFGCRFNSPVILRGCSSSHKETPRQSGHGPSPELARHPVAGSAPMVVAIRPASRSF